MLRGKKATAKQCFLGIGILAGIYLISDAAMHYNIIWEGMKQGWNNTNI